VVDSGQGGIPMSEFDLLWATDPAFRVMFSACVLIAAAGAGSLLANLMFAINPGDAKDLK
jgi:hypothetical protein